jgi:Zn-dependent protease with chaperone function
MGSENRPTPARTWLVVWVIASSLIWAAVVIVVDDIGWPLVVWALTTFAPVAVSRQREAGADSA